MAKAQRHKFEPGARSIIQMGEELIGHPSTAINELVKNGYDADALKCRVYFNHDSEIKKSFAFVSDNGSGMDYDTLFGGWLHPSISTKRASEARSKIYKRHYLGSKGIGRLAAMAIGRFVTVITRQSDVVDYNWITIDKNAFKEDKLLNEIDFPGDVIADFRDLFTQPHLVKERKTFVNPTLISILNKNELQTFKKGTIVIVECLDDSVNAILERDFLSEKESLDNNLVSTSFYKSLATLVTPLKLSDDIQKELRKKEIITRVKQTAAEGSNFLIEFSTNLLPDSKIHKIDWQSVKPIPVHKAYDYRVFGKVTVEGNVEGEFVYNRLQNDVFEEPFEILSNEIDEDSDKLDNNSISDHKVGEYYFDIRAYDVGEKDNLQKLTTLSGFKTIPEFRSSFKAFQGLRVSKNGFGVKPYGEEVEDWIGLSKARVQNPGQNVNTNQILGYVYFFSPDNDSLEEKTNREGFLENASFIQVKKTLLTIFKNLGRKRYNYRALHEIGRVPTSRHLRPDFEEFLRTINNRSDLQYIRDYSSKFMSEVTTSMDNLEESLSFSERLASLGSGIELVYHEMAQPISRIQSTRSSLNLKKDKLDKSALPNFINDINTLGESTEVLVELRKSLQPAIGRSRKKKFRPYQTFLKVCTLFKSDFQEARIKIVSDEAFADIEFDEQEYAFWIAFLNIVNNAVYWIKKSERPGEIRFVMKGATIIISNSGPPIKEELIEHIFHYGVTTKQEKNATGLGLAYTRRTLNSMDWEVVAENRKTGPAFIITKLENE
jgi:signal transduction histidine kinase